MDNSLHVACSPLTGKIYCGRVLKDGKTWGAGKTDVTSDVLKAVIDKVGVGETMVVNVAGAPMYQISVQLIQA